MLGRPCQVHFSRFPFSIQTIQMSVDPFVLCSILSKKLNFTSELTSSYRGSWRAQSRGKVQQVWAWQRGLCSPSQSPRQAWTEWAPARIWNWTIFRNISWPHSQHRRNLHSYHHGLYLSLLHVVVAPLEQVLHGGLLVRVEHHHGRHPLLTLRVAKANHRTILQRKKYWRPWRHDVCQESNFYRSQVRLLFTPASKKVSDASDTWLMWLWWRCQFKACWGFADAYIVESDGERLVTKVGEKD